MPEETKSTFVPLVNYDNLYNQFMTEAQYAIKRASSRYANIATLELAHTLIHSLAMCANCVQNTEDFTKLRDSITAMSETTYNAIQKKNADFDSENKDTENASYCYPKSPKGRPEI